MSQIAKIYACDVCERPARHFLILNNFLLMRDQNPIYAARCFYCYKNRSNVCEIEEIDEGTFSIARIMDS